MTSQRRWICLLLLLALIATPPASAAVEGGGGMKQYDTRYYVIHTDLPPDLAREAGVRMTKMAEEYHRRTRGFSGAIRAKFPFYLYASEADYLEAGGQPGSAGQYDPNRRVLMACADAGRDGRISPAVWHTIQHEGFHQFADAVIGGDLPVWVNEGMAEYFGEAVFTGDGFVSGVIPPWRMRRIVGEIKEGKFRSAEEMMRMSHRAWNAGLNLINYDQAWSMVQFLAHGEEGKYQKPFANFMSRLGRGTPWERAWADTFGNAQGFEDHWKQWWLALPKNPTAELYAEAATATLTSFLARATAAGQSFDGYGDFAAQAAAGTVKDNDADWLPPTLLQNAVRLAGSLQQSDAATFTLARPDPHGPPSITCKLKDGTRYTGTFRASRDGKVLSVDVKAVAGGRGSG